MANFNAVTLRLRPQAREVLIVPDIALPGVTLSSRLVLDEGAECNGWKDEITPFMAEGESPVLVMSGKYMDGGMTDLFAQEGNFKGFFAKPVVLAQLQRKVEELTKR